MQKQDIKNYAQSQNIDLTNEEVDIIYNHIKKYYNELLNKDTRSFQVLKKALRKELYQKIIVLYNTYKNYL